MRAAFRPRQNGCHASGAILWTTILRYLPVRKPGAPHLSRTHKVACGSRAVSRLTVFQGATGGAFLIPTETGRGFPHDAMDALLRSTGHTSTSSTQSQKSTPNGIGGDRSMLYLLFRTSTSTDLYGDSAVSAATELQLEPAQASCWRADPQLALTAMYHPCCG